MPRADGSRPGTAAWTSGLAALAALVNEALAGWGTRPALAAAGGPGAGWMLTAVESPTTRRPRPQPAARPLAPVPAGDDGLTDDLDDDLDPDADPVTAADLTPDGAPADLEGIDDDHVETWRLVHLAQAGDGEAFGQLYDRYVDTVFRFIYYRVNDRALAEDFTSETFVRALRRITTISYQGRDIGAWFVTIARNIVLDHVKSARHRLETTTGETVEGREHAQSTENAVLESLAAETLMRAVEQLGDEQRECVMLRFMQGLSVSETAAVMGKNDGAIKALQHRAVRKLAALLGDDLR